MRWPNWVVQILGIKVFMVEVSNQQSEHRFALAVRIATFLPVRLEQSYLSYRQAHSHTDMSVHVSVSISIGIFKTLHCNFSHVPKNRISLWLSLSESVSTFLTLGRSSLQLQLRLSLRYQLSLFWHATTLSYCLLLERSNRSFRIVVTKFRLGYV